MERRREVVQSLRSLHTSAYASAQLIEPSQDPQYQIVLGKWQVTPVVAAQQLRQPLVDLLDRESLIHAQHRGCLLHAQLWSFPTLTDRITRADESDHLAVLALGAEHQQGIGLGQPGEIVEVARLAEWPGVVVVALLLTGRRHDRHAALSHGLDQPFSSPLVFTSLGRCRT